MSELLLNPAHYDAPHFDDETRRLLRATIDFFEQRGKKQLTSDYHGKVWYQDFLDFQAKEKLFAHFLTPARDAAVSPRVVIFGTTGSPARRR